MTDIEKSILATIIYYNILDFPLTSWEIRRFLVNPKRISPGGNLGNFELEEIIKSVQGLINRGELQESNGFYFLPGRKNLYQKRIEKKKISDQKWKKAVRVFKWFQAVPYVKAVFASGSLAIENTDKDSDWDVLVIAKAGRLWTCRFLLSLVMTILRVRRKRYDKIAPDKVCLNHYITDRSLNIPFQSLYNAQTYAHFIPVWTSNDKIIKQFEKENEWIKKFVNQWDISDNRRFRSVAHRPLLKVIANVWERILKPGLGEAIESILKKIQYKRIIKNPDYKKAGGRITADDLQLEFHPDSPEKDILNRFNSKIKEQPFFINYKEVDSGLR